MGRAEKILHGVCTLSLVQWQCIYKEGGGITLEHPKELHTKALTKYAERVQEIITLMEEIKEISGEDVFLDALQEECAELIHAASKYRRARGWSKSPTPMPVSEAWQNLREEIQDVQMLIDAVRIHVMHEDPTEQLDNLQELCKWRRWRKRLKEG